MKLVRYGALGLEKLGLIDCEVTCRDLKLVLLDFRSV